MSEPSDTIKGYVGDLIAVHRHVLEAIKRHVEDKELTALPDAESTLHDTITVLTRNMRGLEERLQALGGPGAAGQIKEAVTTMTGFLTGVFGQVRGETASRMLRDNYTAINFIMICATMLHTTARAFRDDYTASVTHNIMNELPPVLMRLADLVPHAVVADLAKKYPAIDNTADESAIREAREAWRVHAGAGQDAGGEDLGRFTTSGRFEVSPGL